MNNHLLLSNLRYVQDMGAIVSVGKKRRDLEARENDDTNKRKRLLSEDQVSQLDGVVQEIIWWISEHQNNLPKTRTELSEIFSIFCEDFVQVDPKIIYYHLLLNGILTVNDAGDLCTNVNNSPTYLQAFVLGDSKLPQLFSSEFCSVLQNAVLWVKQRPNMICDEPQFMAELTKICTFKRSVPIRAVFDTMLYHDLLSFDDHDVHYSFIPQPELLHYKPHRLAM